MSGNTGIQWTDATWNPIRGCSRVSEGCKHCYAEVVAARFSGEGQAYHGLARRRSNGEAQWTGKILFVEKVLRQPLRWREPRRIFVNSMSDLFHEKVTDEQLDLIFAVMALAPRHTFQILTKRPERMRHYLNGVSLVGDITGRSWRIREAGHALGVAIPDDVNFALPLPNVWLGVSVENQEAANERIPLLVDTPAAVRFLSCEPLLGSLDLYDWLYDPSDHSPLPDFEHPTPTSRGLGWVIVGGESGAGARACHRGWVKEIVLQCRGAGVPVFVKQLGAVQVDWEEDGIVGCEHANKKGGDPSEWPDDLRSREFPAVSQ